MGRAKKNAKVLNIKLDAEIYERFEQYANELGQTKTTAIERILKKHLDGFEFGTNEEKHIASDPSPKQSGMKTSAIQEDKERDF